MGDYFTGSRYADSLAAGAGDDAIHGSAGADTLTGGLGSDEFRYASVADFAGDVIDGTAEAGKTDTLRLSGNGTYDFTAASVTNIDAIHFVGTTGTIKVSDALAASGRTSSGTPGLTVEANTQTTGDVVIDASAVATGRNLRLVSSGVEDATIIGSQGADYISKWTGAGSIAAGAGADTISFHSGSHTVDAGSGDDRIDLGAQAEVVLDGGQGTDTLGLLYDWSYYAIDQQGSETIIRYNAAHVATLTDVEFIDFGDGLMSLEDALRQPARTVADVGHVYALNALDGADDSASGTTLDNDTDPNPGDTKTFAGIVAGGRTTVDVGDLIAVSGSLEVEGVYGTLTIDAAGAWSYLLDDADPDTIALGEGRTAIDRFTYGVVDIDNLVGLGEIQVNVHGGNQPIAITAGAWTDINENTRPVFAITTADLDVDNPKVFTLSGADAGFFRIGSTTGLIELINPLNFEARADADHNGVYEFTVNASDGHATDTRTYSIRVNNVDEAPVITSNSASVAVDENTMAVATVAASDPEGSGVSYSLSGADSALFEISSSGVVSFRLAPDFETPKDAGGNNVYDISVIVSDGLLSTSQDLAVVVQDLNGSIINANDKANKIDTKNKVSGKGATSEEDKINAKGGNDTIKGAGGNDTLIGGAGKDTLYGNAGADRFVFNAKLGSSNVDAIKDFAVNLDVIELDRDIFRKIGAQLDAGEFYAKAGATKAHDKSDRIVYDTKSGKLYYDDDGKGGHAAVHFATLSSKLALDHEDFIIV